MIIQNCCEVDLCWKKPILNIQLKWIEPIYTGDDDSPDSLVSAAGAWSLEGSLALAGRTLGTAQVPQLLHLGRIGSWQIHTKVHKSTISRLLASATRGEMGKAKMELA